MFKPIKLPTTPYKITGRTRNKWKYRNQVGKEITYNDKEYAGLIWTMDFIERYLAFLKANKIKQVTVIREMKRRGFEKFSDDFFRNCRLGRVYCPKLHVLVHLCHIANTSIEEVLTQPNN